MEAKNKGAERFQRRLRRAYSYASYDDDRIDLQREALEHTRVPRQWADTIRKVYGPRWDEDVKASAFVLERVYLSCHSHDWHLEVDALEGLPYILPANAQGGFTTAYRQQERGDARWGVMKRLLVGSFRQEDTSTAQVAWERWAFFDTVVPRVNALHGRNPERRTNCPYCDGKLGQDVSCSCGFPGLDPQEYIEGYALRLKGLRQELKLLACGFDGYLGYHRRFAISDGVEWWQEPYEGAGEGNVFSRYAAKGYAVFQDNSLMQTGSYRE